MVFRHHPDHHPHHRGSSDAFARVQEAYAVLSDPAKRRRYDYETFLFRSRRHVSFEANSTEELADHFRQLQARLQRADPFRVNKDALYIELQTLLSDHNLSLLKQQEPVAVILLIRVVLDCTRHLSYKAAKNIGDQLATIDTGNDTIRQLVTGFKRQQWFYHYWNRYKILVAFIVALLLCGYIYYLVK